MAININNYDITDGPSMHDIMTNMLDGHDTVFLTDGGRTRITMLINVVEREDGSGMGFNLEGIIKHNTTTKVHVRTTGVGGPITTLVG
jgi:hypothetical protein